MSAWILIVSMLAYGYGSSQTPAMAMQEFGSQRACGIAADVVRNQFKTLSKKQAGIIGPEIDAVCVPKDSK